MGIARDAASLKWRLVERRERRRLQADASASVDRLPGNSFEVVVYFADPPSHLYQLRQWFEALLALDAHHRVVIVARCARTVRQLQQECSLPIVYASAHRDLDPLVERQPLKIVLYPNHNMRNFAMLWHPDMLHVYIGHGESDKIGISASNQLKAYDYCFVAGQAAIDRIRGRLINYDTGARVIEIGRPQGDSATAPIVPVVTVVPVVPASGGRTVVLYAPTWEGDRPANSYGSLVSHGEKIVSSLVADDDYQVIFRPHPLTGSESADFGAASERIVALLDQANRRDPGAGHRTDRKNEFGWQLQAADACFADISAVAYDWLATRKPLVITKPTAAGANLDPRGIAGKMPLLAADRASMAPTVLTEAMSPQSLSLIDSLATHYFGDLAEGASTRRWLVAVDRVISIRDAAVAGRRDLSGPTG